VCDGLTCSVTTAGTTTAVEPSKEVDRISQVNPEPTISIASEIPEQLLSDTTIVFSAEAADQVDVSVRSLTSGNVYRLEPELFAKQYRILLAVKQFPPGEYKLRIVARNSFGIKDWTSRSWFVKADQKRSVNEVILATTTLSRDRVSASSTNNFAVASTSATTSKVVATTSSTMTLSRPFEPSAKPLSLSVLPTTKEGMIPLLITTSTSTEFIEVYARRTRALVAEFLGLAEHRSSDWVYFINTNDLPPDTYEVFVTTMKSGNRLRSESEIVSWLPTRIPLQVETSSNERPIIEERPFVTTRDSAIPTQSSATSSDETKEPEEQSDVATSSLAGASAPALGVSSTLPLSVVPVTNLALALEEQYATEINSVLKRLAAAHQANNQILVAALQSELAELRVNIVTAAINDENLRPFITTLDEALEVRLAMYAKRVETFERIRSERSGGRATQDTDADGISDLDETILFNTDPSQADTDEDGISDGIEIARGFDPISSESEAIVAYEDPRTIPIITPDVLIVHDVTPAIIETQNAPLRVAAEVRGKGIPNSFATLFIFSEPTIITVRTESDGSFSYRFDRELPDGRHEVYVALTDNAGAIVARSEPFAFIKTAQAFTPVGKADVPSTTVVPATERVLLPFAPAVVGTAMLALGLILLALGASLRLRPPLVTPAPPSQTV
jgi:hypothetical protein